MATPDSTAQRDYLRAIFAFDAVVQRVDPARWSDPAPCEGWVARDVVSHMAFMADMVSGMARGEPAVIEADEGFPAPGVADRVIRDELLQMVLSPAVGPDDDPVEIWAEHRDRLLDAIGDRAALANASMSPWGHTTTESFLPLAGGDAVVHAWDLATASGIEPGIAPDLAESALRAWSESEAAGSPVRQTHVLDEAVSTDATDPVSRLVAYSGRNPN